MLNPKLHDDDDVPNLHVIDYDVLLDQRWDFPNIVTRKITMILLVNQCLQSVEFNDLKIL